MTLSASEFTNLTNTQAGSALDLAQQLLGPVSGLSILQAEYTGAAAAVAGFSANGRTGVLLSSGLAQIATTNSATGTGFDHQSAGDADLDALLQGISAEAPASRDAARLDIFFTVSDTAASALVMSALLASEGGAQTAGNRDIAAVFLDGTNLALLDGDPSRPLAMPFVNSETGLMLDNATGIYATEYDLISQPLALAGTLDPANPIHKLTILVADSGDGLRDTAVLLADLRLVGGIGADGTKRIVTATESGDVLSQTGSSEQILAGGGNDIIQGAGGADDIYGNVGNDVIYGQVGSDYVLGGQGLDTLYGGQDGDVLFGNADNDIGYGNVASDTLNGDGGHDQLYGGLDIDILAGGAGNDTLIGGQGNDQLTGGSGADVFAFASNHGEDYIVDFTAGEDSLLFIGLTAANLTIGEDASNAFIEYGPGQQVILIGMTAAQVENALTFT